LLDMDTLVQVPECVVYDNMFEGSIASLSASAELTAKCALQMQLMVNFT
jgi:hypothetical protein